MEISSLSPTLSLSSFPKPSSLSSSTSTLFFSPTTGATASAAALFRSVNPTRLTLNRARPAYPARNRGLVCNSLFGLGVPELAVIAGVAALVFGPKQLPEIGRTLGKSIKGFQQAAKEFERELKNPEEAESPDNLVEGKPASQSSEDTENFVSSSKETP